MDREIVEQICLHFIVYISLQRRLRTFITYEYNRDECWRGGGALIGLNWFNSKPYNAVPQSQLVKGIFMIYRYLNTNLESVVSGQQAVVGCQQAVFSSHQSLVNSQQSIVSSQQSEVISQQSLVSSHQSVVSSQKLVVSSQQSKVSSH